MSGRPRGRQRLPAKGWEGISRCGRGPPRMRMVVAHPRARVRVRRAAAEGTQGGPDSAGFPGTAVVPVQDDRRVHRGKVLRESCARETGWGMLGVLFSHGTQSPGVLDRRGRQGHGELWGRQILCVFSLFSPSVFSVVIYPSSFRKFRPVLSGPALRTALGFG